MVELRGASHPRINRVLQTKIAFRSVDRSNHLRWYHVARARTFAWVYLAPAGGSSEETAGHRRRIGKEALGWLRKSTVAITHISRLRRYFNLLLFGTTRGYNFSWGHVECVIPINWGIPRPSSSSVRKKGNSSEGGVGSRAAGDHTDVHMSKGV